MKEELSLVAYIVCSKRYYFRALSLATHTRRRHWNRENQSPKTFQLQFKFSVLCFLPPVTLSLSHTHTFSQFDTSRSVLLKNTSPPSNLSRKTIANSVVRYVGVEKKPVERKRTQTWPSFRFALCVLMCYVIKLNSLFNTRHVLKYISCFCEICSKLNENFFFVNEKFSSSATHLPPLPTPLPPTTTVEFSFTLISHHRWLLMVAVNFYTHPPIVVGSCQPDNILVTKLIFSYICTKRHTSESCRWWRLCPIFGFHFLIQFKISWCSIQSVTILLIVIYCVFETPNFYENCVNY